MHEYHMSNTTEQPYGCGISCYCALPDESPGGISDWVGSDMTLGDSVSPFRCNWSGIVSDSQFITPCDAFRGVSRVEPTGDEVYADRSDS
jgi:hypothetical protein